MPKRATGRFERTTVAGEAVAAFVPHALPPADPPVVIGAELAERLRAAEQALVRLELAGEMVPSLDWFIYAFVRKEAVLSSQIEGTQATLVDLLTFEAHEGAEQSPDVEDVCNYLDALAYARAELLSTEPQGPTDESAPYASTLTLPDAGPVLSVSARALDDLGEPGTSTVRSITLAK